MRSDVTIRKPMLLAGACLGILMSTSVDAAFLDGKMLRVTLDHKTNLQDVETGVAALITVGPGVELEDFGMREEPDLPPLVDIDITDATILITAVADQPMAFLERLQFSDSTGTVPRFTDLILVSTNWSGFTPSRLNSGPEALFVTISGLSGLAGQQILLQVVPEPASAALAAASSVAMLALRRKMR
jgi:hypothetical protein